MKKITQIAALSAALCISNTMEADDKMGTLTPKEQNIALAAAYAAKGDQNGLKGALAAGLDSGVSVNEYKEVLVQVYAYCGFPRSLNSLGTFMELLKERGRKRRPGCASRAASQRAEHWFRNGKPDEAYGARGKGAAL